MFVDNAVAARVAYLLTVPYESWPAYKQGLIDKEGKKLREPKTEAERDAWTPLHRMIWRIRTLLAKAPGGASGLARLGATWLMMRENNSDLEAQIDELLLMAEDTGIGAVAGANVGPGEGLGTTKKMPLVRRKPKTKFKDWISDGVNK